MRGYLEELLVKICPEVAGGDGLNLLHLFYGAELIRRGVLLEGLRTWGKVAPWGSREIVLASKLVDPNILLNAVAEQYHGGFDRRDKAGLANLVAGALLGPRVTLVSRFYEHAGRFITRVVGTKYEDRCSHLSECSIGDYVRLWHEKHNRYDPMAVKVVAKNGYGWYELGYVRSPIARKLARRMMSGAVMEGRIAVLLGEQADPNERVYVKVDVWDGVCGGEARAVREDTVYADKK
ncbi:MAG: HIRAN domain-containing protein [Bacillota bacterium]|jgi:hypothetical protein